MAHFIFSENVEKDELSIVLIGDFNPVIVTPFWLSSKSLIRESEATSAKIRIIHHDIVEFDLEWAALEITQKRFQIKCTQVPFFEITRDLVAGIFSFLRETPITSFGFNHHKVIGLKNENRFFEFGDKLSPLKNWSTYLHDPRLQKIEILEKESKKKGAGSVLISIQSAVSPDVNFGVAIIINDHYDFSLEKDGLKFSPSYIMKYWPSSIEIANNILSNLSNSLQL